VNSAANTITWSTGVAGNYKVDIYLSAATSVTALAQASLTGGVSALALFTDPAIDDGSVVTSLAGTTVHPAVLSVCLTVTNAGGTYVITPGTITTSGAGSLDVFITPLPATLLTMSVDEMEQREIEELRARADEQDRKIAVLMRLVSQPSSPMESYADGGATGLSSSSSSSVVVGQGGKLELGNSLADLEKSVHLPRSLFKKLVGAP